MSSQSNVSVVSEPLSSEEYENFMAEFPRQTGLRPIASTSHGYSAYGLDPSTTTVAKSGPARGVHPVYRQDDEMLFRFDTRTPKVIFQEGLRPWNGQRPVSLQAYQKWGDRSAFVSLSRDGSPENVTGNLPSIRVAEEFYRYNVTTRGGIDLLATLKQYTMYPHEQEILKWKGVRREDIASCTVFDRNMRKLHELTNPHYVRNHSHPAGPVAHSYASYAAGFAATSHSSGRSSPSSHGEPHRPSSKGKGQAKGKTMGHS